MISEEQRTWRTGLRAAMAEVARPVYPTLRERVESCLLAAGFRPYSVPSKGSRGQFLLKSGAGLEVSVEWWDSSAAQRRELLERFAVALEGEFTVEDRGDRLYVAEDVTRSRI